MVKKDCFAYIPATTKKKEHCAALKKLYCAEEEYCRFYKTREQLRKEKEKCSRR